MRRISIAALATVSFALLTLACTATFAWATEPGSTDERLPAFDEYVPADEPPEAVQKPGPVYPPLAKQAGVEGMVVVQALVGRDGKVRDTRITKSIPMLDAAAMDAVRQWRFKPAMSQGSPVAVWVRIPVWFNSGGRPPEPSSGPTPPPVRAPIEAPLRDSRTITPDKLRDLPVERVFGGTYFINSDSTDRVIVTRGNGGRVRLESPGQWRGKGTFDGRTYHGTFEYLRTAPDPRNHGARGTHFGTYSMDGRMTVDGAFTNRSWPPFHITWSPLFGELHFRGGRRAVPKRQFDGRAISPPATPTPGTGSRP